MCREAKALKPIDQGAHFFPIAGFSMRSSSGGFQQKELILKLCEEKIKTGRFDDDLSFLYPIRIAGLLSIRFYSATGDFSTCLKEWF